MKKSIHFFLLFFIIIPVSCKDYNCYVLEKKDVQFFNIDEINKDNKTKLRISGLAFHSSLAVSHIRTKEEEGKIFVLVYLVPTQKKLSGNFNVELLINDSVKEVFFGNGKTLIWYKKNNLR